MNSFWKKVNKAGPIVGPDLGPCWLWTAAKRRGYGAFGIGGKMKSAHRVSLEEVNGPIPDGFQIHHRCEVRACVNPAHLQTVTPRDHLIELSPNGLTYKNARKTMCVNGHALTPENTKRRSNGARLCRECQRTRDTDYRARNRRKTT